MPWGLSRSTGNKSNDCLAPSENLSLISWREQATFR